MDSGRAKNMIEQMQKREFHKSPESKRKVPKEIRDQIIRKNEDEKEKQMKSIRKMKDDPTFNEMLKLTNESLNICHGLEYQFKQVKEEMKYGQERHESEEDRFQDSHARSNAKKKSTALAIGAQISSKTAHSLKQQVNNKNNRENKVAEKQYIRP